MINERAEAFAICIAELELAIPAHNNLMMGLGLAEAAKAARAAWSDVASKGACEYAALCIENLTPDATAALEERDDEKFLEGEKHVWDLVKDTLPGFDTDKLGYDLDKWLESFRVEVIREHEEHRINNEWAVRGINPLSQPTAKSEPRT